MLYAWFGLVWFGLVWFGLVWFGLDWIAANVVIFGWLVNSLLEKRNERDFVNTD